jgi:formimidoylglutamate deiminase
MDWVHARSALLADGWRENVRVGSDNGVIRAIEAGVAPADGDDRHEVIVPGMPNLHSHAFQRAMAGLAETRGPADDSFWSWRKVMYKFALSMSPDHVQAVAAQLYMEMLEAGFSRVGEFHYLHHDKHGGHYADIAEMAGQIAAAASTTGIGLTLLPVFYAHSGFGAAPPLEGQRRFINTVDGFERLLQRCRGIADSIPGATVGVAPHSLRAVTPDELAQIVTMADGAPIHIHVAEQVKEVEDCIAWSGARPVAWLLDHASVDGSWCLIHATHLTDTEKERFAKSGAVAGLCPITEANLGDGIFSASCVLQHGGQFGVGSDCNILISVAEELRQLEYSQRLADRARNVIATAGGSTARTLFDQALSGGGAALSCRPEIRIEAGADFVSLDVSAVPYLKGDQILDHWVFAGRVPVDTVWTRGFKQVTNGRHVKREEISKRFRAAMHDLLEKS